MKKIIVLVITIALFLFLAGCNESAHKHNYIKNVVYPTCTEKGYISNICECGEEYKDEYVDELGHSIMNGLF